MASELSSLRETAGEVHHLAQRMYWFVLLAATVRRTLAPLRDLVDLLLEEGRMHLRELESLVSYSTSRGFNRWVERTQISVAEVEKKRRQRLVEMDEEP